MWSQWNSSEITRHTIIINLPLLDFPPSIQELYACFLYCENALGPLKLSWSSITYYLECKLFLFVCLFDQINLVLFSIPIVISSVSLGKLFHLSKLQFFQIYDGHNRTSFLSNSGRIRNTIWKAASRALGSWLNASCYSGPFGGGFDFLSPSL